ncbi:UNVERIFIED_CONTAM: hypothetical protein PYX00_000316 [Menopon gallinae]|uniref:CCR4-NOT transcription complex subunit 10 n=1 Tax=Menopon gallinae TaxID=328185 RepID=A0AAW2I9A1_9NEOP
MSMADKAVEKSTSSSNSGLVVSDQEQDLAQSALADFTKGNYAGCLGSLSKLELTWTHDAKVAHNKAVAEFYKSDLKKTDQFRKNLNNLRSQPIWNGDEVVKLEDVEQCALYYNHAIILYHMKQYNLALKVVKEVFTFIEPMEESLAHKVCLLLIELLLCMRQVDSALDYLLHITTQFASTKNIQVLEKEPADKKPVVFDAATDAFRLKLLQFQTRCYLMNNYLEGGKKELKAIMSSGGVNISSIFLKANLEYMKKNYTKAIKVLNSMTGHTLPSFKDTGESINVLYFNNMACIHHYMRKPNLACFYLQKAIRENEEAIQSFPSPDPSEPLSNRPLYTLGSNKNTELMYNLGVVLLYAGKPTKAFDCFTEAVQVFHMNPRLWLRMAECCIMAHKSGNEEDFNLHVRKNDLVQSIIGTGIHRKLILANRLSKESQYNNECQSYAIPAPTLEFASLCIRNALHLLPPEEEGEVSDGRSTPILDTTKWNTEKPVEWKSSFYGAPSNLIDNIEVKNLRCSILAAAAYVTLCLGDYLIALEYAQELLLQSGLSGVHKMLGHLYAAEAYIFTDRIQEAIEHLNPDLITDLSFQANSSAEESTENHSKPLKDWFPNNILTAKILMQYHLAVAFAVRGEFEKSGETLKHLWMLKGNCEVPIQVVMLALYIELQLGHAENSRTIIKQHCPHLR